MSRHHFDCERDGHRIRITLGYDRPLDEYFLQVQFLRSVNEDLSFLYASVADPEAIGTDLEYFKRKLHSIGISVPVRMFTEVLNDASDQVGNKVVEHFADGRWRVLGENQG